MKNVHRMIVTILSFVFANALVLLFMPPSTRAQEATPLEPGKPIEREITGGETVEFGAQRHAQLFEFGPGRADDEQRANLALAHVR